MVIRYCAFLMVLCGFLLIGHEIVENVLCHDPSCQKLHLGTMLWGLALVSLGLLIIQKGDVSASLKDFTSAGSIVRSWWRPGRADDAPGTVVRSEVVEPGKDNPPPAAGGPG